MHTLKMARPFIVDMHEHTHPWDVCYWADLQYSFFVPRMEQCWALGFLGVAEFTVALSSVLGWHQRVCTLQPGETGISFLLALVRCSDLQ